MFDLEQADSVDAGAPFDLEPAALGFAASDLTFDFLAADGSFVFPPHEPGGYLSIDAQIAMFGAPVMTLDGFDQAWPEGVFALPHDGIPHFGADDSHFNFDAPDATDFSNAYLL